MDAQWRIVENNCREWEADGSKMLAPMKRNIIVRVAGETLTPEFVFQGRSLETKV